MFGWLKRPSATDLRAEDPSPPETPRVTAANGRPLRPRIRGLTNSIYATREQKLQALEWAKEWTGNCCAPVDIDDLLAPLDAAMAGKRSKTSDPSGPIVSGALRALNLSAQENRAERTQGAFPWIEFRLGPQEQPCQAARQLANRLIPFPDLPLIPVPECDERECKCWFRSVTKAEKFKRSSP